MRNALTVDLEDWFQVTNFETIVPRSEWDSCPSRVEDSTRRLLDLFERFSVHGTFFVLGWVAERFPGLVREVADRGHEIASHGYLHELVYTLDPERFAADVRRSVDVIESACGIRARGYRAPSFSIDHRAPWAFDVLAECGMDYDSSVFPVHHPRYGVPAFARVPRRVRTLGGRELVEFPMTTLRAFGRNWGASGGGYLRLLPLQVLVTAFRRMNADGRPAVLYIHPWEIDPDQPRVKVRGLGRITHYTNLVATYGRLERLLAAFDFGTMRDALAAAPDLTDEPLAVQEMVR
jgi:polysaccharide deacetylase family protein (PEP-CTERM system associated)